MLSNRPFVYLGGLGYWQEPDLGLTYVRQRWLDTTTGQWLSVDPVEGEPRYAYAYNSPTVYTDPDGTQAFSLEDVAKAILNGGRRIIDFPGWLYDRAIRWIWADSPYASDEALHAALGQAESTLESELSTIHSVNDSILRTSEKAVMRWAKGIGKGYARTFSAIASSMKHHLPFREKIPKRILDEIDKLIDHRREETRARAELEPWQRVFVPPARGTAEEFEYRVGFLWGAAVSVYDSVNLVNQVAGIFDMLILIAKTEPSFWSMAESFGKQYAQSVFGHLNDKYVSAFQQGKLAAIVLMNLVVLVLMVVGAVRGGFKLAKRLQSAVKVVDKKVQALAVKIAQRRDLTKRAVAAMEAAYTGLNDGKHLSPYRRLATLTHAAIYDREIFAATVDDKRMMEIFRRRFKDNPPGIVGNKHDGTGNIAFSYCEVDNLERGSVEHGTAVHVYAPSGERGNQLQRIIATVENHPLGGKSIHNRYVQSPEEMRVPRRFENIDTLPKYSRRLRPATLDSETKILEYYMRRTTPLSRGRIVIVSDFVVCNNCRYVARQFRQARPFIKLIIRAVQEDL